ncbi:Ger(x)C family spore germination protein [Paenibacillus qinlingensis]|uniref:Ger(x)C family spore germination protein n=1 Tax=Paenibacillus qinlingensis TaxID=1837343 RepID=UPI00156636C2|nr:Ger(x)C family spore germination protein [Paenibacillus qinlingensis]NQX58313.1 Ger(x)C family spore germination protein [Paenibacillus qinlingensis]
MKYKLTVMLLCLLLLSGCWSRRELNELLIVLGVGVDWKDGEYLVSFQVVNPSEISAQRRGGDRPPSTLYQGRGKTLFEAARSLTAEAPRKVYMGHLQMYVIGEELAKRGIKDFLDNSVRDNELRMDFNIVVARGDMAENILKLFTPVEKLSSYSMQQSLQTSQRSWAPTVAMTLDEALNKLSGKGFELALTGIKLIGDTSMGESKKNVEFFQPPSRFRYMGIAAFKEDKLIGWLDEQESKGYTDITNNLDSTSIEIPCAEQKYTGIEITSSDSKLKASIENGKPVIDVSIRAEANIVDRQCRDIDLKDPQTIKRLEQETRQIIQSNVEATVTRAKKMKSDLIGFGSQLGKDQPAYWKEVKETWNDEMFPQTIVNYKIELFIRKTGTIGNSTMQ